MGGYGPPMPGRRVGAPLGPQYGGPQSPDLVGSRTPVANQIVDGINSFVEGFKTSKESEKQAARQRFLEGVQMMQMGLPVDQKKMARDARTAGLNFDYEGPTAAERQAQQQQAAPMPGMPMPSGDMMQLPPGIAPMGIGNGGMMASPEMMGGRSMADPRMMVRPEMFGGRKMSDPRMMVSPEAMGGRSAPMPGPGGGGRGFFGRLGQAMTQPFQAPPPIPDSAGVYQALDKIQQMGQPSMEDQAKAQIFQTLLTAKTDSPEFVEAAIRGGVMGLTKELPQFIQDEAALQGLANKIPGMTVQKLRDKATAVEMLKLVMPLVGKVAPENVTAIMQSISGGKMPDDATLFEQAPEPLISGKEAFRLLGSQYPTLPKAALAAGATILAMGDFEAFDQIAAIFPPSVAELEQQYSENREARAVEDSERTARSEDRSVDEAGRAAARFKEWSEQMALEVQASQIWAAGNQKLDTALEIVNSKWVDREKRLALQDILKKKSRGGAMQLLGAGQLE